MFETDLNETFSELYTRKFAEKFFPVLFIKKPDYLIIEDRRPSSFMLALLLCVVIGLAVFVGLIGATFAKGWLMWAEIGVAFMIPFLFLWLLPFAFGQRMIFYKEKDAYEIIEKQFFFSQKTIGKISEIRYLHLEEICIIGRDRENYPEEERTKNYETRGYLVLKNDERKTIVKKTFHNDYRLTRKIVFGISEFLNISVSETEKTKG